MILWRVLSAEMLKMKRTIALKMVLLAPATVAILILFVTAQAPFSTLKLNGIRDVWLVLTGLTLRVWAALMMPLLMTLETALVAGLEHSENQWKSLLARPIPRWTPYVAKLMTVSCMTMAGTFLLLGGIVADGAILGRVQSDVVFGRQVPWAAILRDGGRVAGLGFLALTIQHWISLRWRSFSVAVGAGIVCLVVGFFAMAVGQQGTQTWFQYFPWALPMLPLWRQPHNIGTILWIEGGAGLLVAVAGCVEFCRREVT